MRPKSQLYRHDDGLMRLLQLSGFGSREICRVVSAREPVARKLNWLEHNLPEAFYVKGGRLQQLTRKVYILSRGPLIWQPTAISLQNLLQLRLVVGGRPPTYS